MAKATKSIMLRISKADKAFLKRSADIKRKSLSQFIREAAWNEAVRVMRHNGDLAKLVAKITPENRHEEVKW